MKQPPKLATWLLNTLSTEDRAVAGDLREAFADGKSAIWYWRQVVGIMSHAIWRDARRSWAVVVAVSVSGLVLTMLAPLVTGLIMTFDEQLFARGFRWFYINGYRLPSTVLNHPWLVWTAVFALIAWTEGRLAGRKQALVVITFAASIFIGGVISPMVEIWGSLTPISYHVAFHFVTFDVYIARLTRHFNFNGDVSSLNALTLYVVILPLITLIAGLSARQRSATQPRVTA